MGKILSCITNRVFINCECDYNKLYILAVLNNSDITWHLIEQNNNNEKQIDLIYEYFKNKCDRKFINIEHFEDCELKYENIKNLICKESNALFIKIYYE